MKYCLSLLILFSFALSGGAQRNFEGRVNYIMVSRDSTVLVNIEAWFTKNKIKAVVEVKKAPANTDLKTETIIIDFKKAAFDRYKPERKKIERESMRGKGGKQDIPNLQKDGSTRSILNYACTGYTTGPISKEETKDSVAVKTELEIKFWYANNLFYEIADSLKMIQMIPLFTNGRIALGSTIAIHAGALKLILQTEAKAIYPSWKRLARSIFQHPKDYTLVYKD